LALRRAVVAGSAELAGPGPFRLSRPPRKEKSRENREDRGSGQILVSGAVLPRDSRSEASEEEPSLAELGEGFDHHPEGNQRLERGSSSIPGLLESHPDRDWMPAHPEVPRSKRTMYPSVRDGLMATPSASARLSG
jgi:hypothetical protein